MIKGWKLNPSWVAYYEMVKGYREIRRQQSIAVAELQFVPYPTKPSVVVDVDKMFPERQRSH